MYGNGTMPDNFPDLESFLKHIARACLNNVAAAIEIWGRALAWRVQGDNYSKNFQNPFKDPLVERLENSD
jgi:hypothetical protein